MRHSLPMLSGLVCLLATTPVLGGDLREPNPEFDPDDMDLREFVYPRTEVLTEPETITPRPNGWRDGGEFELDGKSIEIRICDVHRNPYFDCLFLTCRPGRHPDDLRPLRAWAGDERWARVGEPVGFTGRYSMGDVVKWQWDFGDGATRHERNCGHVFREVGDYHVTLTATDRAGHRHDHTVTVHVRRPTDRVVRDRDGKPCLMAYGDATSDVALPKRTDMVAKRTMVNHTHY